MLDAQACIKYNITKFGALTQSDYTIVTRFIEI